jgi:hypothetical protein
MPVTADLAVAMLMQVTADDQTHIGSIELAEQLRPNRWRNARRTHDIVGWVFEEERLVQEQGGGALPGAQLLIEPLVLFVFPRQARTKKLRVDAKQAPAARIQGPPIDGKRAIPSCESIRIDDLVRVLTGRFVAYVVVARQRHDPRTQLPERAGRESDLGVTVGSIDRQVAVDDDRIAFAASANSRATHQFSQKIPCVGERWMSDKTTMRAMLSSYP